MVIDRKLQNRSTTCKGADVDVSFFFNYRDLLEDALRILKKIEPKDLNRIARSINKLNLILRRLNTGIDRSQSDNAHAQPVVDGEKIRYDFYNDLVAYT